MKRALVWCAIFAAACDSGASAPAKGTGSQDGTGLDSGGRSDDASGRMDAQGTGEDAGDDGAPDAPVRRTGMGKINQGCVTHADCAPGFFCYLGYQQLTDTCLQGPSGSCATCQGGACPSPFACSCLAPSLCPLAMPCSDDGKVIVCPPLPN